MILLRFACLICASTALPISAEQLAKPFLFSVERDGSTSYIFGTMHIGISSSQLPGFVLEALRSQQIIAPKNVLDDVSSLLPQERSLPTPPSGLAQILRKRGIPDALHTVPGICERYMQNENRSAIRRYLSGEVSKLASCSATCMKRSIRWIPKLESWHRKGFFALFGHGHLKGEHGIIRLLEQRGFQIRRIDSREKFERSLVRDTL